jgi:hypothetical protein
VDAVGLSGTEEGAGEAEAAWEADAGWLLFFGSGAAGRQTHGTRKGGRHTKNDASSFCLTFILFRSREEHRPLCTRNKTPPVRERPPPQTFLLLFEEKMSPRRSYCWPTLAGSTTAAPP